MATVTKEKTEELIGRIRGELTLAITKANDYKQEETDENYNEMISAINRAMGLAGQLRG